jgi:poly-gamma-glutamate capsule biosynthesis protein CapA/YwtB (metallophosphatase superfamily)
MLRGARGVTLLLLCLLLPLGCRAGSAEPVMPDLSPYPWLFLRDGQPLVPEERVAEVILVGDVMLGRAVAAEAAPLEEVTRWLRAADLVVGNLEAIITEGGAPAPAEEGSRPILLRASPSAAQTLREAGFDVLGHANNHALDYGPSALEESVERLRSAGIESVGAGETLEAAREPVVVEVNGVRLGILAFNFVPIPHRSDSGWQPALWDEEAVTEAIRAARARADGVIVLAHWGSEYEQRVDPSQRRAAEAMWAAGADLVVGSHPHVVQGTAARDGRFVAYSLGNFVFDQSSPETRQGLALRAFFDREGLRAIQALPLRAGPRPRLMSLEDARGLLARVEPVLPRVGFACDSDGCQQVEPGPARRAGRFTLGQIDLTGDGEPEQVRLVDEQVVVSRGGEELWRGLPGWRVVDLALGDPNDDGRWEAVLALWKADDEGVERSHPFIVGYRGGSYRVLWGGSAVADPIHEVELGDVDGDGREELVVLESAANNQRRVAIWKWHGWGYSLFWRSEAGDFKDLVVQEGASGKAQVNVAVSSPAPAHSIQNR